MAAIVPSLRAQSLFDAPDTVCIRQPIRLTNLASGAGPFYWGFCSGYLMASTPTATDLGAGFGFDKASAIEIAKDGNNYYGFVANKGTGELLKLNYGTSLNSTPTVTNLGKLNNTFPNEANALYLTRTSTGNWFLFAVGGTDQANSTMARFDFGSSLANPANSVNFGNPGNMLDAPHGLFVAEEAGNWYGYTINTLSATLLRISFGPNISTTPTISAAGSPGSMSAPSDFAPIQTGGNWYLFVTNAGTNSVSRIDLGNSLTNAPAGTSTNVGNLSGSMFNPSGISITRDCGATIALITNELSNELVRMDLSNITGPYASKNFGGLGGVFSSPSAISGILRDKDDLIAYITNTTTNGLTRVDFAQCSNASIPSSTAGTPPVYSYDAPGTYNVYFVVNDGQPNMQVECKQIVALPIPALTLSRDTSICQGDTILLIAQSPNALSYTWRPNYNLSDTLGITIEAWPEYSVPYRVTIPYANGCIVDTVVNVEVWKNRADAGPDRTLFDGASTVLGGPLTSMGPQYTYTWTPSNFLNNTTDPNTVATPAFDFTYYLEVKDIHGCSDIDTVVVLTSCNDLHLPNAFVPESKFATGSNRFGILNKQIVKLNYFRIYDRWGKEVFQTTDVTKSWDGTVDGEVAPLGVYVWEADGFCVSGRRFKRSGNVTLIR